MSERTKSPIEKQIQESRLTKRDTRREREERENC
jgi:hypothetical protein